MPEDPILVTAPAGNVGKEVVRALRERGIPVRAGVRDPSRVSMPEGVEPVRFDFDDVSTFAPALVGARGLFLLRPTQIARVNGTLLPAIENAQRAGVRHCVFLSVDGAERQPWLPHRKVEKAVEASELSWTFLRPNHFMQNLLGPYRQSIIAGRLALPAGQGRISFVDCADIGELAAIAFADPARHTGHAYHLTGPQALSFSELAAELSRLIGHRVRYEPIGPLKYMRELRATGAPFAYSAILTFLHLGARRGGPAHVDPILGELLGRPPHTIAEFISAHVSELTAPAPAPAPAAASGTP